MVQRGFTLLEVMIVIIILGILGAIVAPQFTSATSDAKASALKSGLGGVRSGIAAFRANAILAGDPPYPTLAQLQAVGVVMQEGLPENPYNRQRTVQTVTLLQAQNRSVVGGAGWNYFVDNAAIPPVAIFYANSNAEAGQDGSYNTVTANRH